MVRDEGKEREGNKPRIVVNQPNIGDTVRSRGETAGRGYSNN